MRIFLDCQFGGTRSSDGNNNFLLGAVGCQHNNGVLCGLALGQCHNFVIVASQNIGPSALLIDTKAAVDRFQIALRLERGFIVVYVRDGQCPPEITRASVYNAARIIPCNFRLIIGALDADVDGCFGTIDWSCDDGVFELVVLTKTLNVIAIVIQGVGPFAGRGDAECAIPGRNVILTDKQSRIICAIRYAQFAGCDGWAARRPILRHHAAIAAFNDRFHARRTLAADTHSQRGAAEKE